MEQWIFSACSCHPVCSSLPALSSWHIVQRLQLHTRVKVLLIRSILKVLNHATRIPSLVVNQLWIWLNKLLLLLRPDPARLPPLPGTQLLAIQTSQCLLLNVYYTALFYLQAVSTTHAHFFSVRLFFKLVYGKRGSVRKAWLSTFKLL